MTAREKVCGAYILTHVQSGCIYIGSTGDLFLRSWRHRNELKRGVHRCKRLQALYSGDQNIAFTEVPTSTKEEAIDEEQRLIDLNKGSTLLLNVVTLNVRNTMASIFANGHRHSDETRKRMSEAKKGTKLPASTRLKMGQASGKTKAVIIDGIEYFSIRAASEALGVTFDQVRNRTKSPNYPTWLRKPSNEEGN